MPENTEVKGVQENTEEQGNKEVKESIEGQKVSVGTLLSAFNTLSDKIKNDISEREEKGFRYNPAKKIEYGQPIKNILDKFKQELYNYGFTVEVLEDIDLTDVTTASKFVIRITYHNSYIDIDYFKYREICLDYTANEVVFISECIEKLVGNTRDSKLPEYIVGYLSYVCHFKEAQSKVYNIIGWSTYEETTIFKYDGIYSNTGIGGRCIAGYAEALQPEKFDEDDEALWLGALIKVLNDSATASLIISAGISGIFRQMLPYTKETNINMNIQGERGCGKSTICHFLLSFFGNPEYLEGSFTDTDNAMEIIRAQRPIMPYVLDERMLKVEGVSADNKRKTLLLDIFREYEGRIKERAGKQYDDLSGKRTYSPIISSSVEPMLNIVLDNTDLGQFRRFIEINLDGQELFQGDRKYAEAIEDVSYTCYGYGIQLLLTYIFENNLEDGAEIKRTFDKLTEEIGAILKATEERNQVKGLTSSTKRFALILLSYNMLISALKYRFEWDKDINILDRQDDILGHLVINIVKKMKKVQVEVKVRENIVRFVDAHKNLFYQDTKLWDGKGEYLGSLTVTDEFYIIDMKKSSNVGWLLVSPIDFKEEELSKYSELISDKIDKKVVQAMVSKLVGDMKDKDFKKFMEKNKDEAKLEESRGSAGVRFDRLIVSRKEYNGIGKEVKEETEE